MTAPIVVDIDGTMSRPDRSIPGSVIDRLFEWSGPIVIATGKAFPYPVAMCDFIGIDIRVIAENGGICCVDDAVHLLGSSDGTDRFVTALADQGYGLGWGEADFVNRWRETEVAIDRSIPRDVVDEAARRVGLEVIDSKFAYHVKSPEVSKGDALETVAGDLGIDTEEFVAIGDSENDLSTFSVAGGSIAVANADPDLKSQADRVTDASYSDGLHEALDMVKDGFPGGG